MSGLRLLFAPEEGDAPPAHRSRRDWIVDWVIFLVAIGGGVASLVSSVHHGLHGWLVVVDAVLGAGLTLALWWRRRWPVALALATVAIGPLSSFAGAPGVFFLYTVAAYRRWQAAVLVAVLGFALYPVDRAVHPQGDSLSEGIVGGILFGAVVIAWGMFRRSRRQTKRERLRRAQAEERLRVEQIRHAERTRIAREMHDVLAHRISLLSLHAGALEFRPDASPAEVARAAAVIRASAHRALEDLRAVIAMLRDGTDGEAPQPPQQTIASLPGLLEESRAAGMDLRADLRADLAAVPDGLGRNALRIVQEALTNARKHAPSAAVELRIEGAPGTGLAIAVRNRAPALAAGATEIPGSGTGLVGLAERAVLAGGSLERGVDANGNFQLLAWLPWPK